LKKQLLDQIEQENSHQLDEDLTFSVQASCLATAFVAAFVVAYSRMALTVDFGQNLIVAALMLLGTLVLLFTAVLYTRYRSTCTFWEYVLSLRRIPLSHWIIPSKLDLAGQNQSGLQSRLQLLSRRRCCPHHRPKHKAPILLFQQAPLLLAP
jgi:hypothetical protein